MGKAKSAVSSVPRGASVRVLMKALLRAGKIQVVVEGECGRIAARRGAFTEGINQHDNHGQDQQEKEEHSRRCQAARP